MKLTFVTATFSLLWLLCFVSIMRDFLGRNKREIAFFRCSRNPVKCCYDIVDWAVSYLLPKLIRLPFPQSRQATVILYNCHQELELSRFTVYGFVPINWAALIQHLLCLIMLKVFFSPHFPSTRVHHLWNLKLRNEFDLFAFLSPRLLTWYFSHFRTYDLPTYLHTYPENSSFRERKAEDVSYNAVTNPQLSPL